MKKLALRSTVGFFAFAVLIILVPLEFYWIGFAGLLAAGTLLVDHRNGALAVVSVFALVAALEIVVRLAGAGAVTPYYRPHEMLARETRYLANRRVAMTEPHGDLLAIDPRLDRTLAQAEQTVFQTDSRGFRNSSELQPGELILVGDSFVVGIGNTQDHTITSKLEKHLGKPTYNMGFPAGPYQYANTIVAARSDPSVGEEACIVVLFSEGNDFQIIDPAELAARNTMPRGLQDYMKRCFKAVRAPFEVSRVAYGLVSRGSEKIRRLFARGPAENITFVRTVGGRPMAFLRAYADVVMRESYDDHEYLSGLFAHAVPDLIGFVPDKYRVYAGLLDGQPQKNLPGAQLAHLEKVAAALGVPTIDLTGALRSRSVELLAEGELTYWRDDTHWNQHGIEVAAREIARALSVHGKLACREAVSGAADGTPGGLPN